MKILTSVTLFILMVPCCKRGVDEPPEKPDRKWIRVVPDRPAGPDSVPAKQVLGEDSSIAADTVSTPETVAQIPADRLPDYRRAYRLASKSVVLISARTEHASRVGAGWAIGSGDRIVTSSKLVQGANQIIVKTIDGHSFSASLAGTDRFTQIALLNIKGENLPAPATLSRASPEVGQWILGIGNPMGLSFSASRGIISAIGRSGPVWDHTSYGDFIQVDMPTNKGNSGGPLIDLDGRAIGLITVIEMDGKQLAFAIPCDMVKTVVEHLQVHGRLVRSWLGIMFSEQDLTVTRIRIGSPASRSKLETGDRIISIAGETVETPEQLRWKIATAPAEKSTQMTVERLGEVLLLDLTLEKVPELP